MSVYNPDQPFKIYCLDCFYSDKWDVLEYGRDFDFNRPFFEQFWELEVAVPKLTLQLSSDVINSEYCNHVAASKNCYLIFASVNNEDCMYCNYVSNSKNVLDGLRVSRSELMYECVDCYDSYNLKFSQQCHGCHDSSFLYNCRGSSNCFLSSNLVNKSYYIRNKPYSKEEYFRIISGFDMKRRSVVSELLREFSDIKKGSIHRSREGANNNNSKGNYLTNTRDCYECYDLNNAENCRYVAYGDNVKDTMDAYAAYPTTELCYETVGSGAPASRALFSYLPWQSTDVMYSINVLQGSRNCFGCSQVKGVEYCILNKKHSKGEYERLVPRIIEHMRETGEWGEYFPPKISPFCYNETVATNFFPLKKEEALEKGFRWSDYEPPPPEVEKVVEADDLPDSLDEVGEEAANWAVRCETSGRLFRITGAELSFYRKNNLPLPRRHYDVRHEDRLKLRLPMKLWDRNCNKCGEKVETPYDPSRPEKVYCEECFKSEIY